MAILITGTGLVGCQAAQILVQRGERPVLFDLAPQMDNISRIADLSKITIVRGDITEPLELINVIKKYEVDRVIHTAAVMLAEIADRPANGIKANIMGTVNILEAARVMGLKRVVFTSSGVVCFGAVPFMEAESFSEDFPTRSLSGRPQQIYFTTKIACEYLGLNYVDIYKLDLVVVRFAGVFGPWKTRLPGVYGKMMREITEKFVTQERIVLDKNLTWTGEGDFVYSKDAAYSTVLACFAENPRNKVYNIGMGQGYTDSEVFEILKKLNPQAALQIERGVEEHFGTLNGPPLPLMDISKAREELGYEPRYKMEAALKDYSEWLKANLA